MSIRVFQRKEKVEFRASFYADSAHAVPLIPIDAAQYPAYVIYDPDNQEIQSGVAQPVNTPGQYKLEFTIQDDYPLSSDVARWRIEWYFVTDSNRQVDFVEEFDVIDAVITASESREQKLIAMAGEEQRIFIRLGYEPVEVMVNMYQYGGETKIVSGVYPSTIQRAVEGDSLVYYYDIPGNKIGKNVSYNILWKVRGSVSEPYDHLFQNLTSVSPNTMVLVTSLRMLIDKLQKKLGTIKAYEDSDLVEYLNRGMQLTNSYGAYTNYNLNTMPNVLAVYLILFSGWYAIQAQYLLGVDTAFNFGGQSVTLDYDQTSGLSDWAGRVNDYITATLPQVKTQLVRRTQSAGCVAGRAMRWNQYNFSYKIASSGGFANGQSVVATLTNLGLLW